MFCYCRSQLLHTADSHNTDVNKQRGTEEHGISTFIQTVATKQVIRYQKCSDKSTLVSLCGHTSLEIWKTLQWAVETKQT